MPPTPPPALVERDGAVMTLTLNRPERLNAITGEMLAIMADTWAEAKADDTIRCLIITGAGGNFSSGADLKAMAGADGTTSSGNTLAQRAKDDPAFAERGFLKLDRPLKPIIAAVEGVAIAGGTEILLGTDIRVAGENARFGVSEARWSLYPMMGAAVRMPKQIPHTQAAEILLTGKHINAAEAERIGLIGRVVPDGQALATAHEIAAQISANGPLAVEAILQTIRETVGLTEEAGFAHEAERANAVFASEDAVEGPRAFAEKRTPVFHRR